MMGTGNTGGTFLTPQPARFYTVVCAAAFKSLRDATSTAFNQTTKLLLNAGACGGAPGITLLQMAISAAIGGASPFGLRLTEYTPLPNREAAYDTAVLGALVTAGIGTLNACIGLMHVSLVMVLRSTEPALVLVLAHCMLPASQLPSPAKAAAILPVVVGAALSASGAHAPSASGIALALVCNGCSALRGIQSKRIGAKFKTDPSSEWFHICVSGTALQTAYILASDLVFAIPLPRADAAAARAGNHRPRVGRRLLRAHAAQLALPRPHVGSLPLALQLAAPTGHHPGGAALRADGVLAAQQLRHRLRVRRCGAVRPALMAPATRATWAHALLLRARLVEFGLSDMLTSVKRWTGPQCRLGWAETENGSSVGDPAVFEHAGDNKLLLAVSTLDTTLLTRTTDGRWLGTKWPWTSGAARPTAGAAVAPRDTVALLRSDACVRNTRGWRTATRLHVQPSCGRAQHVRRGQRFSDPGVPGAAIGHDTLHRRQRSRSLAQNHLRAAVRAPASTLDFLYNF